MSKQTDLLNLTDAITANGTALKVDTIQTAAGGVPTASDLGINVAGSVVQVVQQTYTTVISATAVETALWSTSITPKFANSKILIDFRPQGRMHSAFSSDVFEYGFKIRRGAVAILTELGHAKSHYTLNDSTQYQTITGVGMHSDSPNSTSLVTYDFSILVGGTGTYGTMTVNDFQAVSSVTLMEIKQ
jgi:hypothetical protein